MPAPRGFAPSSSLMGGSTLPQGMEVSEISADVFEEAERTQGSFRRH